MMCIQGNVYLLLNHFIKTMWCVFKVNYFQVGNCNDLHLWVDPYLVNKRQCRTMKGMSWRTGTENIIHTVINMRNTKNWVSCDWTTLLLA